MRNTISWCLVATLLVVFANASVESDAWNRFYSAYAEHLAGPGGSTDGLVFFPTPTAIGTDWPTTGAFQEYSWCNNAPEWQWNYVANGNVYSGYTEMVDSLLYKANDEALSLALKKKIVCDNLAAEVNTCFMGLTAKWEQFHKSQSTLPADQQTTYTQWMDQFGKPLCQTESEQQSACVAQYEKLLSASFVSGYDYVLNAITGLSDPDNYEMVFDGKQNLNVSECTLTPPVLNTITNWQTGVDLNPGGFSVSSDTATENTWDFQAEGGGAGFLDVFGIEGGGTYERHQVDTSSSSFSMKVSYEAQEQFQFNRAPWYDASLIQGHKNGPWNPDSPVATGTAQLWGPGGMLGLVPSALVVTYQASIEISMEESDYQSIKESWTQESGVCIFIFCFESESSSHHSSYTWNDHKFSLSVSDTSEIPKITAMLNAANKLPTISNSFRPTTELNTQGFKVLSGNPVHFQVLPNHVKIASEGAHFQGEVHVTLGDQEDEAGPLLIGLQANVDLTPEQWNCLGRIRGLGRYNGVNWDFFYENYAARSLAHLSFRSGTNGQSAHYTCRDAWPNPTTTRHYNAVNNGGLDRFVRSCPVQSAAAISTLVQRTRGCLA